jgi:hypothetical protein
MQDSLGLRAHASRAGWLLGVDSVAARPLAACLLLEAFLPLDNTAILRYYNPVPLARNVAPP